MGVGFFATLHSETGEVNGSFGSTGTVEVSDLILENPVVHTTTTETQYEHSLIGDLTSSIGGLLDGLLDGLLGGLLGINVELGDVLTALLDARKADPTALTTGSFAGRVVGDVQISNCDAVSPSVENANSSTGGFVGYTEGETSYATEGLGNAVELLAGILNSIPGLGLGDLITILLKNDLEVGKLVPTGYTAPEITGCKVTGLGGTIGAVGKDYAGGFVGLQIGTKITDCSVVGADNGFSVVGERYAGGFVGLARDAEIKGTLSSLGVDLVDLIKLYLPQSLISNCSVSAASVSVSGGDYLGGFVGALANSYTVNDSLDAEVSVRGTASDSDSVTGSSIGGFAGIATTGWVTNLGADEDPDHNLLGSVSDLVTDLISKNPGQANMLLSLAGVAPSAIVGCQVNDSSNASANTVTVFGYDFVGGMVGKGDGLLLASSTPDNIKKMAALNEIAGSLVESRTSVLNGLSTVTAKEGYAGGVAGSLCAASAAGLLNKTLGVGSFLGFDVNDMKVVGTSDGATVNATHYAGGAFGEAVGGDASSVAVSGMASASAKNYAGGFVGVCGPGDLADTGGITLNLLGLNKLLEIDNLLSIIPGLKVKFDDCSVAGRDGGFSVESQGDDESDVDYAAGGFAAYSGSAEMNGCSVKNLSKVIAPDDNGNAGGFVGVSTANQLADVVNEDGNSNVGGSLLSVDGLLGAVGSMVPDYTNCTVMYVNGGSVQADVAGGFAGDFQSGTVDNQSRKDDDHYAVYNIGSVKGQTYAGGFGGLVHSGALASAGEGISVLGDIGLEINLEQLLNVVQAYVPFVQYAGVKSDGGFTVEAKQIDDIDAYSGSAGGFVGYASGAQISNCDVNALKKTDVQAPEDLESSDAPSYFDGSSSYAVTGGRYAGGFAGCMDVGSAASVGKGISVLGLNIALSDLLSVLNVVVTTVEHSNVTGAAGGFNILASAGGTDSDQVGMAGGFAGAIYGGHVQDSHANNFEYVIGQVAAGGYVGEMEPGDVTRLLDKADVLNSLVSTSEAMASLLQTFVPTIRNSTTDCVPCGGVVRAQAESDDEMICGMAGGYVGHNMGGSIWGNSDASWKGEGYDGPQSPCSADRIRSVYGAEYAGGYVGLMEAADTADVGGLSVLSGLIKVDNVLGVLSVVYPTQECTEVTGPLENLDLDTWNAWVDHIGVQGGYGADLAQNGKFGSQDDLDAALSKYVYGFNVVAGRSSYDAQADASAGVAGGYAGLMRSGVVTDGMAYDVKDVRAMRAAGGYAGAMEVGGAANLGSVSILGLGLDLGSLLQAVEVFVPVVKGSSSVGGYSHGMKVQALGTGAAEDDKTHGCGHAGGYVGLAQGAQIWGDIEGAKGCNVNNLRMVKGANTVGGFAGTAGAGTVANANTNASDGLLQGVLDQLIKQQGDLASVLEATMTTIRGASVSPDDKAWGFVVDGSIDRNGTTEYATAAGGFVGSAEAAILGDEDGKTDAGADSALTVVGLRAVSGGEHAGGFVGLADVGSVASVGDSGSGSADKTTLLGLIGLGNVSVLDAFRTYIYHASVAGVSDGAQVRANKAGYTGEQDSTRYLGNAGGFAGSLLNGSVKDSSVSNLLLVDAPSYAGGFTGYMGKNGTVDVDSANADVGEIYKLLGAQAGILDIWGSHAERCSVSGVVSGFSVSSGARSDVSADLQDASGAQQIAGGFVGLGDLSRIADCSVTGLGMVRSDQAAGGFIGQTDMAYVANAQVDSELLNLLLFIVNQLVKALYVDDLEKLDVIDLSGSPIANLLNLKILSDGDLLYVNLLGLKVSVALSKADASDPSGQQTDVAIITIGDSTIKLPCNENGLTGSEDDSKANLEVTLIKGNRTVVDDCTVSGIASGYDVFGGGATQDADGAALEVGQGPSQDGTYVDDAGYAGGFVGHNKEGVFEGNTMTYCDVVRGTSGLVGPFSGKTDLKSTYNYFNQVSSIEGKDQEGAFNMYSIYRPFDASLTAAKTADEVQFATATEDKDAGVDYNRFTVNHYGDQVEGSMGISSYEQLKDAVMSGDSGETTPLDTYISPAKAVLMGDASYSTPSGGITPEPGEGQDPCDANVQITLQKVWNDGGDSQGIRPDSVTFVLKRSYTDANGQQTVDQTFDDDGKMEVMLTAADDASDWSNTWRKVVSDLPVAFEDKSVSPAKTRYYTYYVEEISYGEYSSDVSYSYTVSKDDTGYVVTVTNSLPLPETGGSGESPYLWLAVLLLLLGIAWYVYRQRKETTSATCSPYSTGRTVKRSGRTWRGLFGRAHKGLHARRR